MYEVKEAIKNTLTVLAAILAVLVSLILIGIGYGMVLTVPFLVVYGAFKALGIV